MKPHNFSKRFACPNYYFLGPFSTDFFWFFVPARAYDGALPLTFFPVRFHSPAYGCLVIAADDGERMMFLTFSYCVWSYLYHII